MSPKFTVTRPWRRVLSATVFPALLCLLGQSPESSLGSSCQPCKILAVLKDPVHYSYTLTYPSETERDASYDNLYSQKDGRTILDVKKGGGTPDWTVTVYCQQWETDYIISKSKDCNKIDGRAEPKSPENDPGQATENLPIEQPAGCATCGARTSGNDGSTPVPPYQYNLDIGAGRTPQATGGREGAPLGRLRFMHNFADGEINLYPDFYKFAWDDFGYDPLITYTDSDLPGRSELYDTITTLQAKFKFTWTLNSAHDAVAQVQVVVSPVVASNQPGWFESHTLVFTLIPSQSGRPGAGVEIVDTNTFSGVVRTSRVFGTSSFSTPSADVEWYSESFDGTISSGTSVVSLISGTTNEYQRESYVTTTTSPALGSHGTLNHSIFNISVDGNRTMLVQQDLSIVGDSSAGIRSTTYTYYPDIPNSGSNANQIKSVVYPDGSWVIYSNYDDQDRPHKTLKPFGNSPAAPTTPTAVDALIANPAGCLQDLAAFTVETGTYYDSNSDEIRNVTVPKVTTESHELYVDGLHIGGSMKERRLISKSFFGSNFPAEASAGPLGDYTLVETDLLLDVATQQWQGTWNLSSASAVADASDYEDGLLPAIRYEASIVNDRLVHKAFEPPPSGSPAGAASYFVETAYPVDATYVTILAPRCPVSSKVWLNRNDDEILRKTYLDTTLVDTVQTTYKEREVLTVTKNGFVTYQSTGTTLNSGALETQVQDGVGNITKTIVDPVSGVTLKTISYHVSAPSNVVTTEFTTSGNTRTQTTTGATLVQTQTTVLDGWGRPASITASDGTVTTYGYTNGGRTVTKTQKGATTITDLTLDGRISSITGTGQVAEYHNYAVLNLAVVLDGWESEAGVGVIKDTVHYGSTTGARYGVTITDGLARVVAEWKPAPPQVSGSAGLITKNIAYDGCSRPVVETQTGAPTRLHEYFFSPDSSQTIVREALDLPPPDGEPDGVINAEDGPDAVTETVTDWKPDSGATWEVTTTNVYGTGSSNGTRTTSVWRQLGVGGLSKTLSKASDLSQLITTADIKSSSGSVLGMSYLAKDTVVTESSKASSTGTVVNRRTSVYRGGLLISEKTSTPDTEVIGYTYDGLRRRTARSGAGRNETWGYDATTGWLTSHTAGTSTGALTTTSSYGTTTTLPSYGRVTSTSVPGGSGSGFSTTYYAYDTQGRMIYQWGNGSNPAAYGYDAGTGELTTLKTYQNTMVDGWANSTQPLPTVWDSTSGSTTTWGYDAASGALLSKTDAAGQAVQYRYDTAGRLSKRTWARGTTTTYGYDEAGRAKSLTYSDGTPAVSYTYNRAGELATQTDATGSHTFTRDGSGLNVTDSVATGAGEWQDLSFVRAASTVNDSGNFRAESLVVKKSGTTFYDTSRRQIVGGPYQSVTGLGVKTTYAYDSNGRSSGFTETAESGYPSFTTADATRIVGYDSQNRLSTIKYGNSTDTSPGRAGWTYGFDGAWRRNSITPADSGRTGWSYSYNDEGAVKTAKRKLGSTLVSNQQWDYDYDAIGNRTQVAKGSATTSYTLPSGSSAHDGTQYASITRPTTVDISGIVVTKAPADPNSPASLMMDGAAPTTGTASANMGETGSYYREFDLADTGSTSQARWVKLQAQTGNGGQLASRQGWYFYRGASETFTYDLDGNLTADARWTYIWDAENQLVEMNEKVIAGPSGATVPARLKLQFVYDANGRRAAKRVYRWNGAEWKQGTDLIFVYDGWNLVAELDGLNSNSVRRRYVWGPDLSGTMGRAGGVGGLLTVEDSLDGVRYQAQNDANGNVVGLMALDGTKASKLVGRFDYDAFGNRVTTALPPGLDACPVGFSSKYEDRETGLLYYGYRYYLPELGRWPNRDPIGERGGENLYGMIGNDGINFSDILGLRSGTYDGPDAAGMAGALEAKAKTEADRQATLTNIRNGLSGKAAGPGAREWAGLVCKSCTNNKFYYTAPNPGTPVYELDPRFNGESFPDKSPCDKGDRKVATYHSHPSSHGPSEPDQKTTDKSKYPDYVGKGEPGTVPSVDRNDPDPNYNPQRPWNNSPAPGGGRVNGGGGPITPMR